ncbi:unnamed protein product, partial [Owenia fusiformis]
FWSFHASYINRQIYRMKFGTKKKELLRLNLPQMTLNSNAHNWGATGTPIGFDPFQVFEVRHRACSLLYVTVKCGRNISKGSSTKDLMDTPDPYVRLRLPNSPDGRRKTMHYDNEINPKWEESFRFYLDTDKNNTL